MVFNYLMRLGIYLICFSRTDEYDLFKKLYKTRGNNFVTFSPETFLVNQSGKVELHLIFTKLRATKFLYIVNRKLEKVFGLSKKGKFSLDTTFTC